jgi:hypothetical protein
VTRRDYSASQRARQAERGLYDEAPQLARSRHASTLAELFLDGGHEAVERVTRAAACVRSYSGGDGFLLSCQRQQERGGETWLPSPKQTDVILRKCR